MCGMIRQFGRGGNASLSRNPVCSAKRTILNDEFTGARLGTGTGLGRRRGASESKM